jgi:PST family polysaccharide transporter
VILDIINRPILAVLSSIAQDREKLASAYAKATQSTLSMGIPIACGQALVAPEIVRLGLGPNWAGSAPLFQFLSLAIIPLLFSNLTTSLFFAAGRPELVFSRNFLDLLFRIPATVVLTVLFGVTGAVAAMALSEMVLAMICIRSVKQILGLSIRAQLFQPRRSIMSAGSMGLAVEILRWLEPPHPGLLSTFLFLLSAIPAAAISYACMHLLLWQLEGRPDGIERLAITLVGGRVRRFSWSLKAVENADR